MEARSPAPRVLAVTVATLILLVGIAIFGYSTPFPDASLAVLAGLKPQWSFREAPIPRDRIVKDEVPV